MGGKGRKRREKNFRAAHGGYNTLPPPPDHSKLDVLPSKLRQIISFTSSQPQGAGSLSKDVKQPKKREGGVGQNNIHSKEKVEDQHTDNKQGDTDGQSKSPQHEDSSDEQLRQSSGNEKNKKKRKRKEVKDLRFEMEVEKSKSQLKKRDRKKKYLEARKKHKKANAEEFLDFPGKEKIKFGDIVEAPPKLNVIPKAFKNGHDASQERLRLKAIESYRSRKGWTARPGSHLPPQVTTSSP